MQSTTTASFMQSLRLRGIHMIALESSLHVRPRELLTNADRLNLRERKAELIALLTLPDEQPQADWLARWKREHIPWDAGDLVLVDWFVSHRNRLPSDSFELFPFAIVSDPKTFYSALERDIDKGSNGPRAAGLRNELTRLRELFDSSTSR